MLAGLLFGAYSVIKIVPSTQESFQLLYDQVWFAKEKINSSVFLSKFLRYTCDQCIEAGCIEIVAPCLNCHRKKSLSS